tara:strand:- start:29 stop:199 length:171 start_codon:yes stop_codon:yes gene_type:complete
MKTEAELKAEYDAAAAHFYGLIGRATQEEIYAAGKIVDEAEQAWVRAMLPVPKSNP